MMPALILSAAALDQPLPVAMPPAAAAVRDHLRALRDKARDTGAVVLLVLWPSGCWSLLAVDVPAGMALESPADLLPSLQAAPAAMAHFEQQAQAGNPLAWLALQWPAAVLH